MQHYHAVVWLDHNEAKVFYFDRNAVDEIDVATRAANHHLHHKKGSIAGKRQPEDQHYYHSIVEALAPAKVWLIVGPGSAKLELVKHIHRHDASLSDHIVGVETVDHPTDGQLVAHARAYFKEYNSLHTGL